MSEIHERTISIRNLSYSRALLLKMRLEQEGIPCFITNIQQTATGVDLFFSEAFASKALPLIESFRQAFGHEKEAMVDRLRKVRRILVPVDFSAHSIQAAHYALDLARTLKASIRLLNVWSNSFNDGFVYNEMFAFQVNIDEILKEQEAEAERKIKDVLLQLQSRIRDEKIKGVSIDYDLMRGNAIDGILENVKLFKPGLVVMGIRGSQQEGLSFMGSNSAKLIEHCKIPVLTVPAEYDASDFFKPQQIAYITRFDKTDLQAMHQLIALIRPFDVKVYCVHLQTDESETLEKAQMQQYKNYLKQAHIGHEIECHLIETNKSLDGIEQFVQEKRIDMLAITHKKRNLLTQFFRPSLTKKLLFQTNIPILIFRDTGSEQ